MMGAKSKTFVKGSVPIPSIKLGRKRKNDADAMEAEMRVETEARLRPMGGETWPGKSARHNPIPGHIAILVRVLLALLESA